MSDEVDDHEFDEFLDALRRNDVELLDKKFGSRILNYLQKIRFLVRKSFPKLPDGHSDLLAVDAFLRVQLGVAEDEFKFETPDKFIGLILKIASGMSLNSIASENRHQEILRDNAEQLSRSEAFDESILENAREIIESVLGGMSELDRDIIEALLRNESREEIKKKYQTSNRSIERKWSKFLARVRELGRERGE